MKIKKIISLYRYVDPEFRGGFIKLVILMILVGFIEVLSFGSLVPFIAAINNINEFYDNPKVIILRELISINNKYELILILGIIFSIGITLSGISRLYLNYKSTKFSFNLGSNLSNKIFEKILRKSYEDSKSLNSSEAISGLIHKVNMIVFNLINPIMNSIVSIFIASIIMISLLLLNPSFILMILIIFIAIYALIAKYIRIRLGLIGKIISENSDSQVKLLQESFGSVREIVISDLYSIFIKKHKIIENTLRDAQAKNQIYASGPKYVLEMISIVVFVLVLLISLANSSNWTYAVTLIALGAMVSNKMLPLLQQIYVGWVSINTSNDIVDDLLTLLNYSNEEGNIDSKIGINKYILLENVTFKYKSTDEVTLKNINIMIKKGDRVGIIGESGSGKTTLLDLIVGLLEPTSGKIFIDDTELNAKNIKSWQKNISTVSQFIYLIDDTVVNNITFGLSGDNIDYNKVNECIKLSMLDSFVDEMSNNSTFKIGENGVRLSGGQRQRVGIARALYKDAEIIVLDEATSALDKDTEQLVMKTIENLPREKTIFVISHNESSLNICDYIIEVKNGELCKR